jgi:hypothetical protein
VIISVVYLLVRCLLGCLTVLTRRTQDERDMRKNDRHLRREVLDRLLIVNERHLRRVLTEFLPHYNTARHPSLGQLTPAQADSWPPEPVNLANHRMRPKQILGGLTREYYIAALPPHVATEKRRSPPKSYFRAAQVLEPHRSSLQLTGHADFWHPTGPGVATNDVAPSSSDARDCKRRVLTRTGSRRRCRLCCRAWPGPGRRRDAAGPATAGRAAIF